MEGVVFRLPQNGLYYLLPLLPSACVLLARVLRMLVVSMVNDCFAACVCAGRAACVDFNARWAYCHMLVFDCLVKTLQFQIWRQNVHFNNCMCIAFLYYFTHVLCSSFCMLKTNTYKLYLD